MKRFIISMVVVLMSIAGAYAQDPVVYTSKKLAISVVVPDNSKVTKEDKDGLVIMTPDNLFALSIVPFDMKNASEDDVAEAFAILGKAAKLDTKNLEDVEYSSDTIEGVYKLSALGDGATCVGVAGVEKTGEGFLVTVTAGEAYLGYIEVSLKNFNVVK